MDVRSTTSGNFSVGQRAEALKATHNAPQVAPQFAALVKKSAETHSADHFVQFGRKGWCDAMC